ncbi:BadF/BadG/BcrA/BcrD ATPase family protein [Reinekea marina]|uniref:BadF/BadG/BcrA/BcrD ATPase family protein n=2 Tax=Reinekea marina TaxID=1310421 RepID=A0ABV7WPQ2_9GAMM
MSSPYTHIIGIDGGGTQCRTRIADLSGQTLGEAVSGSANIFQNDSLAWHSVSHSIELALERAKLPQDCIKRSYIVAGLAGAEVKSAVESFKAHVQGVGHLDILTDAQTACLGAHQLNNGAIYIVGTGTVGLANRNGKWQKLGGWGFPLNDEGGGAWLGMQAIKQAIKRHDRLIHSTPMTQKVWQQFPGGIDELVAWSQHASSGDYGKFAPIVTEAFAQGDEFAALIIEDQKIILTEQITALISDELPLSLMGGLANWVKALLPKTIQEQIHEPKGDALNGALLLAQQRIQREH